ncbi:hypothetical protein DP149_10220 [Clostridium tetani]|uniref:Capsid protein n=1 Tax=Clostridium tetani (strain Massachusetts / E88) TaxID=212717 RepID=Q894J1_CLOTE|nr:phage capsid protein [Clostridium tetani]AAO36101.1 hypothetical protein CTC_01552 [Clostridium tetani E88]KGI37946.1 phage coat protein gp6 [Clostridium tetani]KGI45331.1 phage coat protein gp6 [Clostridium tetani]KHO31954.1 phage coat protein gp6 [Clostridium tetani]KIG22137.1 phage coat protein gp6 [Clostridium tetani]
MAIENFKKTLWEGALLHNFHNVSIADVITTKPTNKDGNKIIFNRVGAGSVKDYTGSISWDEISTTPIEMTFTQKKYFAFALEDVDKVQLVADIMKSTTEEHSSVLAETVDNYILDKAVKGVKTGNKIGSSTTKKNVNKTNIYDYIVDLGTILSKNKAPKTDRFVVVNSEILGLLSKDDRFTRNPEVLANGVVANAKINGMTVVETEELPVNTVLALHKSSLGYDKQISEIEAMRLQNAFSDGIRGLAVYDGVVLREDAMAVLYYTLDAPSA